MHACLLLRLRLEDHLVVGEGREKKRGGVVLLVGTRECRGKGRMRVFEWTNLTRMKMAVLLHDTAFKF